MKTCPATITKTAPLCVQQEPSSCGAQKPQQLNPDFGTEEIAVKNKKSQQQQGHDHDATKGTEEFLIEASLANLETELLLLPPEKRLALDKAEIKLPTVAKDPAFRMMFLRTENYKADAAANLFADYWTNREELFGEDKAFLPMTQQEGAVKDDLEMLGYGYVQAVPGHARIVLMDPSRSPPKKNYDIDSVVRSVLYVLEKIVSQSEEIQEKGAIVVMNFAKVRSFDSKLFTQLDKYMNHGGFPMRTSISCIIRASPVMSFVIKFIQLFSKDKLHVIRKQADLKEKTGVEDLSVFGTVNHESWLERMRKEEEQSNHF